MTDHCGIKFYASRMICSLNAGMVHAKVVKNDLFLKILNLGLLCTGTENNNGHLVKLTEEGCTGSLMELIKETFANFRQHVKTKHIQTAGFENDKDNLANILQINFAMAYSCEYQNEVQLAYGREKVCNS